MLAKTLALMSSVTVIRFGMTFVKLCLSCVKHNIKRNREQEGGGRTGQLCRVVRGKMSRKPYHFDLFSLPNTEVKGTISILKVATAIVQGSRG